MKFYKSFLYKFIVISFALYCLTNIYSSYPNLLEKIIISDILTIISDTENEIFVSMNDDGSYSTGLYTNPFIPLDISRARMLNEIEINKLSKHNRSENYKELSIIYFNKKLYGKSLYYIDKAIEYNLLCHLCFNIRGLIKIYKNDFQQALQDFETSLQIKKEPETYFNRHLLYSKLGLNKEAFTDLKNSLELEENFIDTKLYLIPYYLSTNEIIIAKNLLNSIKEKVQPTYKIFLAESAIMLSESNVSNAIEDIEKAINLLESQNLTNIGMHTYEFTQLYFSTIVEKLKKLI